MVWRRLLATLFRIIFPFRHTEQLSGWLDLVPYGGGGTVIVLAWLLDRPPLEIALAAVSLIALLSAWAAFTLTRLPTIRLSDPAIYPDEEIDGTPGELWRISVANPGNGGMVHNLEVTLDRCDLPELRLLPITLHRMHDNPPQGGAYQRRWNMRPNEVFPFDLLALSGGVFYLYRSDGDPARQTGPEWLLSRDEMDALNKRIFVEGGGVRFAVRAIADPPVKGVERNYILELGSSGTLLRSDGPARAV